MLTRRWVRDDRGQTLLEFAFTAMIFLLTTLGTIDFARAIWQYNMVSDLAQEGARYAVVHGPNGSSPTSATQANVQTYLEGRALGFTVIVTMTPLVVGSQGTTISVTVHSPFVAATRLLPTSSMTLQSTAKMVVQR